MSPPTEAGGDSAPQIVVFFHCVVSIRSPHRSRGRHDEWHEEANRDMFQSAPPTEAGGDLRGLAAVAAFGNVSIRSPHRSRGRRAVSREIGRYSKFQSAPPTEAGGDTCFWGVAARACCFNPLPPPKQGETPAFARCSTGGCYGPACANLLFCIAGDGVSLLSHSVVACGPR